MSGAIQEVEDEDDSKYTSPKHDRSVASSNRSSVKKGSSAYVTDDKNSRNKGPIVQDGKGIYSSTDSKKGD